MIAKLLLTISSLCVVALLVGTIISSAQTVHMGERMHDLEVTQTQLKLKAHELEEQLADAESIQALRADADLQGYVAVSSVKFVSATRPVAMR